MIAAEGSGLICGRNPADCHGVSTESGSDRVKADSNNRDCHDYYPVASALGTDLILKLGHDSRLLPQAVLYRLAVARSAGLVHFLMFSSVSSVVKSQCPRRSHRRRKFC